MLADLKATWMMEASRSGHERFEGDGLADGQQEAKGLFRFQKFSSQSVTSNFAAHVWSTKCRQKKIAQLGEKSRDETFEPN